MTAAGRDQEQIMKILCIGDSNTYGYDPRSPVGERYPADVRWTERLEDHEIVSCGANGMTVPRDHSAYQGVIRRERPDLIIVMLGTNDLLSGRNAGRTAERMDGFLASLGKEGRQILLVAPPHLQNGAWVQDEVRIRESRKLGELYRELAERNSCLFADAGEWDIELTFDGVHLSPAGHAVFAREMEKTLSRKCG